MRWCFRYSGAEVDELGPNPAGITRDCYLGNMEKIQIPGILFHLASSGGVWLANIRS